jgi:hypothetical protein
VATNRTNKQYYLQARDHMVIYQEALVQTGLTSKYRNIIKQSKISQAIRTLSNNKPIKLKIHYFLKVSEKIALTHFHKIKKICKL